MRIPCFVLFFGLAASLSLLSAGDQSGPPMMVRISVADREAMRQLQSLGVDVEHYRGAVGRDIELVLRRDDLTVLDRAGFSYRVTIPDMDAWHAARPPASPEQVAEGLTALRNQGIESFGYGSMGGFYTYDEASRQLDTMVIRHGALTSPKLNLGSSREGRTMWGLEISDNPGEPEPGEAAVYFDALHHAREPMSMAALMYYMSWLLDNYGTDPEATYLVDNRRLFFLPVVNPDGYVYNQTTNPNGGGDWRKNRSYNFDGSRGVDLNRNYSYQWGYDNIGSSGTPSSDTYRGATPCSEPETRAARDFVMQALPSIAFSMHSVAGRYLNPYGYKDTIVAYERYAQFAGDFSEQNRYLYGTVSQMLDYNSNGTTRDWLHHDMQCYAWTPEVGGSGFWPSQSEIFPIAQENLAALKYITWVAGAFADYQSFHLVGRPYVLPGDTLRLSVTVRNKGLRLAAQNVDVDVRPLTQGVTTLAGAAVHPVIGVGLSAANDSLPFAYLIPSSVSLLSELRFASTVRQDGIVTSRDTFSVTAGYHRVLFSDDAESGLTRWVRSGNGVPWDTAFTLSYRGGHALADSRYGNVANSTNNALTTTSSIDLAGSQNPRLEYFARWANEYQYDYVRLQVSTNGGTSWTTMAGRFTTTVGGQPGYTGNRGRWAAEQISLSPYIGRQIKLRFSLTTDTGTRGDGFYVDDLRVVDYRDTVVTSARQEGELPQSVALDQNFPNPFNPETVIGFRMPQGGRVHLAVYDLLGRTVATLVDGEMEAGSHRAVFDAGGTAERTRVASGVYLYRLTTGGASITRKLIILK